MEPSASRKGNGAQSVISPFTGLRLYSTTAVTAASIAARSAVKRHCPCLRHGRKQVW